MKTTNAMFVLSLMLHMIFCLQDRLPFAHHHQQSVDSCDSRRHPLPQVLKLVDKDDKMMKDKGGRERANYRVVGGRKNVTKTDSGTNLVSNLLNCGDQMLHHQLTPP